MTTIYVTNASDSGPGSLRAAVAEAGAGDTIDLSAVGGTPISLDSPLDIAANVTIDGDNSTAYHRTLIDGEVVVQSGATVTLEHIYIHNDDSGQSAADDAMAGDDGADGAAGQNGGLNQPGTKGGDADPGTDATMSSGVATSGSPALENDGTLTLVLCEIYGLGFGGNDGADGAKGGNGGDGGVGGDGGANANGAAGGIGGDGGSGSSGTNGGDDVAGVINTGVLTIDDSVITGDATGGKGGDGGDGGAAGSGGNGGSGSGGGRGGNGGSGGGGGDGGNGGSAVGGIVNTGTVHIVGAAVLYGDYAQGGAAGAGGDGGAAGSGGAGGQYSDGGTAPDGMDGNDGVNGGSGVAGTATDDYLDKGETTGTFTVNNYFYVFLPEESGQASTLSIPASTPTYFSYEVAEYGGFTEGFPNPGSVDWKVVFGPDSPPAADFVGPTSGTLNYDSNQSGDFLSRSITVQLKGDAAAPQVETFTIELFDPATGDVLGSVDALTQTVINQASNTLVDLTTVAFKPSLEAVWRPATGVLKVIDTAESNAVVATLNYPGATFSGELVTLSSDGGSGTQVSFKAAPLVTVVPDDVVVSNIPDQLYSAYEDAYQSGEFTGIDYFFTQVSGQAYSAYEYDYSAGDAFIGSQFLYTGIADQAYRGEEIDYDGAGRVTRADFTGDSVDPYSSYEYDYVGGVFAGSKFQYTSVPAGATYSSYETDYDQANNFTGDKFFFVDLSSQGYAGEEADFDANGKLARVFLSGVTGEAYSSLEEDYNAGTYTGYKAYYTGILGQSYTGEEVDVTTANQVTRVVYTGMSTTPYSSVEQDYSGGVATDAIFSFTKVTGASYYAYQVEDNASGVAEQETFDLNSGGHTLIALASGRTLTSLGEDKMTGDGATAFVFDAIYGADTIIDFTGTDTVLLPAVEYAQLQSAIQNGDYANANATLSFSDGDTLTFRGMTETSLEALSSHIAPHG